jgi:hypothetical protein
VYSIYQAVSASRPHPLTSSLPLYHLFFSWCQLFPTSRPKSLDAAEGTPPTPVHTEAQYYPSLFTPQYVFVPLLCIKEKTHTYVLLK